MNERGYGREWTELKERVMDKFQPEPDCRTENNMNELTEFLLARIAEDEARANHAKWAMQGEWFTTADDKVDEYVRGLSPARVLAECAAKRRIVYAAMQAQESLDRRRPSATDAINGHVIAYRDVVRQLAAAYSDHPDYRAEWRP